jgi:hypothetical protein
MAMVNEPAVAVVSTMIRGTRGFNVVLRSRHPVGEGAGSKPGGGPNHTGLTRGSRIGIDDTDRP